MNPLLAILTFAIGITTSYVAANTEKAIFIAPPAPPLVDPLQLRARETLSPARPAIRKFLIDLSFDTVTEEFFALEALDIGRKYEVRVCWPASVLPTAPARPT
jgi:hypothetical protein